MLCNRATESSELITEMLTQRQQRLNKQFREEISDIILREMNDPRLRMVTISEVRIDADLSQAIVFISVSPQTPQEDRRHRLDSLSVIIRAAGFIRSQLGKRLHLRRIPELHFKLDNSQERGDRILNLLDQINQEPQHDE